MILLWILFFLCWVFIPPGLCKVDVRHSNSNKAFIATLPDGDYEVVHPFQIRDKNERIGIDTRNYFLKAAEHYQYVTIVIRSSQLGRLKLVLERNNYIFVNQTLFRKLDSSGEHSMSTRLENCYYQGTVSGDVDTFVALSSCNGLRGVIAFPNGTSYGIWPLDGGDRSKRHPHVLYRTSWQEDSRCGASRAAAPQSLKLEHPHRLRRDLSKQTKHIEVALVADYEFVKKHGSIEEEAVTYMLETVNIADLMLSRDLNVRLSVVYSELWMDVQRIDLFEDIERTLAGVVDYSTGHLYNIAKDATLLFTGGSFANRESATATFGSVCTARASAMVKAISMFGAHFSGQLAAQSIAHLLGLEHDSHSCRCEAGSCVMNSQPGHPGASFAWQFSKCSVARTHGVWAAGRVQCLLNKPFQVWELRECGNGVVDRGEECDCGPRETCSDPCCDALTCTLRPHAQCAAHQFCCHRCQVRRAGEVCRESHGACDVAETCDGKGGDCPSDGHLVDGTMCGEAGQCWRGNCSDQHAICAKIWGHGARVGSEACFAQNQRGHEYANCGIGQDGPKPCETADVRCGSLHCAGGSASPRDAALNVFTLQFVQEGEQVQCKSIAHPLLGMAPDGTNCGSGKVCVAGSCVEMTQVSAPVQCPSNNHALQCSGHGDCTTTALCVCFAGWMGKACDRRSNATNSLLPASPGREILIVPSIAMGRSLDTPTLLGILLMVGVVLLLLLVCLLFCYRRRSVVEIPTPTDEKLDESFPDAGNRSIKFGNMPSYREEKRKRKSNKRVYNALNRIQEADEREIASLRGSASLHSGSIHSGSHQMIYTAERVLPGSRSDVGVSRESSRDRLEHIYAESAIGIGYREPSSPLRGTSYANSSRNLFPLSTDLNDSEWIEGSPNGPLKLNNIGMMLRQLQYPSSSGRGSYSEQGEFNEPYSGDGYGDLPPEMPQGMPYPPLPYSDGELSAVEADHHDMGSNTESAQGNNDLDCPEVKEREWEGKSDGRNSFDFPRNQSLFSDPYKLQMSTSMHT